MWVFLSDSFLSIVAKEGTAGAIMNVRARIKGDIERVFPHAKVKNTVRARKSNQQFYDYGFRAEIPVEDVAIAISDKVHEITYTNFKQSVSFQEPTPVHNRHCVYMRVWAAMAHWQDDLTWKGKR